MTQINYYAYTKYDLALLFTLLTLIDSRLAELETQNPQLNALLIVSPDQPDVTPVVPDVTPVQPE